MKKIILSTVMAASFLPMFAQSKFEPEIKVNVEVGIDENKSFSTGGTFIAGYKLTDKFRLGVGVGFSYLELLYEDHYREASAYVPVFVDAKYKFVDEGIAPYVGGSVGYSVFIPYSDYVKNEKLGLMLYPHFGVEFPLKKGAIILEAGYKYQARSSDVVANSGLDYSQAVLAVGYRF